MAPYVPDEVDVFTLPHSRMKGLVNDYVEMIESTNFSSFGDMELLLESLYNTFLEFRTHEQIENKFIMRRLKSKLKELSVEVSAVCNCHKDNALSNMIGFIKAGHTKNTEQDRINYGRQLRQALEDFTSDFLPHMQEEEEVFQPLLLKYFSYAELCRLKKKVIYQHMWRLSASNNTGAEKWVSDLTQKDNYELSSGVESSDDDDTKSDSRSSTANSEPVSPTTQIAHLRPELTQFILSFLSPRDLYLSSGVCQTWRDLCLDPILWPSLLPAQWAQGDWSFTESPVTPDDCSACHNGCQYPSAVDEDADVDETEEAASSCSSREVMMRREAQILTGVCHHLVARVGSGVRKVVLADCKMLTSGMVQKLLRACPNLRHLDVSYTRISDAAFKNAGTKHSLQHIQTLDLAGCIHITDLALVNIALAMTPQDPREYELTRQALVDDNCLCSAFYNLCGKVLQADWGKSTPQGINPEFVTENLTNNDLPQPTNSQLDSYLHPKEAPADVCHTCCTNEDVGVTQVGNVEDCVPNSHLKSVDKNNRKFLGQMKCGLKWLSLSGCLHITDAGIRSLARFAVYPDVAFLDLSGCFNLTGPAISALVKSCPALDPQWLSYCDNILDGPFPMEASGCQNLECGGRRSCCRCGE